MPKRALKIYWPYIAIAVFNCLAIVLLEHIRPRFFLQDDNWAQFGPMMISGAQEFFAKFRLPFWSPWTGLGIPVLEIGTYALLYPVTYLSYAISRWVLGNPYDLIDVYCLFHLVAGTFVAYRVFHSFLADKRSAVFAALSFCYCGFFLVIGRGWYYMTPVAFYLPALFLFFWKNPLREIIGWRRWLLALIIAGFYLAGNAQMWFYALIFWIVACGYVWSHEFKIPLRVLASDFFLSLFARVVLFIGPQLIMQLLIVRGVPRMHDGPGFLPGLMNLILPSSFVSMTLTKIDNPAFVGPLYFGGGVFFLLAAYATLQIFMSRGRALESQRYSLRERRMMTVFTCLFFFIFLWGLSDHYGFLWSLLAFLPPFSSFTYPIKLLPYLHFFAVLVAGVQFRKYFVKDFRGKSIVLILLCGILLLEMLESDRAIYRYGENSYKVDSAFVAALPSDQRISNDTAARSQLLDYSESLPHNVGVLAKKLTLLGYEPFVTFNPNCALGDYKLFFTNFDHLKRVYGSTLEIWSTEKGPKSKIVTDAEPLAFCERSKRPLHVAWDWNELVVDDVNSCGGQPVVLAWNYWNYFSADGFKFERGDTYRIRMINSGSPAPSVTIRYRPPVGFYLLISVLTWAIAEGAARFFRRRSKYAAGS